jgi:hypothetical protein
MGYSFRLNVARGPEKGEGVRVDLDVRRIEICGGGRVVVGDVQDRVEKGLNLRQVEKDAAASLTWIHDRGASRDAISGDVVDGYLRPFVVEEGLVVVQGDVATDVEIGTVEYAIRIVEGYGVGRETVPAMNLSASFF